MKYVEKPVVFIVDAFQFGIDEKPDWFVNSEYVTYDDQKDFCWIRDSDEGPFSDEIYSTRKGDFVIRKESGGMYSCKEDLFKENFVKVEDTE